jgi:hypothetical protein
MVDYLNKYSGEYLIWLKDHPRMPMYLGENPKEIYVLSADGSCFWVDPKYPDKKKLGRWTALDNGITISINGDNSGQYSD